MVDFQVPTASDWRVKFKFLEMAFFNISEAKWPIAFTQRIEQLTSVYDDVRHRAHIAMLNAKLALAPPLVGPEFDKTITLARLREVVVEPHIPTPPTGMTTVHLDLEDHELDGLDMAHLRGLQ